MKLVLTLIIATTLAGCASYQNNSNGLNRDQMNELNNLASMNNVIWGNYGLKQDKYNQFTKADYEQLISKDPSETGNYAQKFYNSLDAKEIYASEMSFIMCGFSKTHAVAFCDDAACSRVDVITETTSSPQLSTLKDKVTSPGDCNAKKK